MVSGKCLGTEVSISCLSTRIRLKGSRVGNWRDEEQFDLEGSRVYKDGHLEGQTGNPGSREGRRAGKVKPWVFEHRVRQKPVLTSIQKPAPVTAWKQRPARAPCRRLRFGYKRRPGDFWPSYSSVFSSLGRQDSSTRSLGARRSAWFSATPRMPSLLCLRFLWEDSPPAALG